MQKKLLGLQGNQIFNQGFFLGGGWGVKNTNLPALLFCSYAK